MITTVTLNTSVDKLYLVDKLEDYTVMRVREVHNTAGGKGLNVSKVAAQLGEQVTAMGFIGGFNGQYVKTMLETEGVKAAFTEIAAETRSCINIREMETGRHTEFLEPGAAVSEEETERFLAAYREQAKRSAVITISGSIPKGVPTDIYCRLIAIAKEESKPVLLDTSGQLLTDGVKALPALIKPNTDEIGQLLGVQITSRQQLIEAAQALHQSGIETVVISLGKEGALIVCKDGIFRGITPDIPVVNTVGCGDSMIAGFAAAIRRGLPAEEMIRLAMAVSTANALTMETGSFCTGDFTRLLKQVQVEKI